MGVQVIPVPPIPIPNSVFYSHSHGIPGPIGNPIPMHISTINLSNALDGAFHFSSDYE